MSLAATAFGEVTALHAGRVARHARRFLHVARKRGELMAEAAAMFPGAMTAISHRYAACRGDNCWRQWNTGVVIANHNSPGSGGDFGHRKRRSRLDEEKLRQARQSATSGCRSRPPFTPPVVRPASRAVPRLSWNHVARPCACRCRSTPTAPPLLYSNVPDASPRNPGRSDRFEPVRFAEQIEAMYAAGVHAPLSKWGPARC
jgi:acyl transferase domain-containing protein